MRSLRVCRALFVAQVQDELAHRTHLAGRLIESVLRLGTGVLGLAVVFSQVQAVQGWTFPATLALLGVYLTLDGLRSLVLGPSIESLAGQGGDVATGRFDFTLLRPLNAQVLSSFQRWRPHAMVDVALGMGVLGIAVAHLGHELTPWRVAAFLVALVAGAASMYAGLLACAALVFWSADVLFTWIFDSVFQLARYPVGLYPGALRLVLTWVVPVGVMTTVPAQALTGDVTWTTLAGAVIAAIALNVSACALFAEGLRRYVSAFS